MALKRKCCGLLIIYLILILSFGVSAADTNSTEKVDYKMVDTDMIASITTDAPSGWWSMLPYWDFITEYYISGSGRIAPTEKTPIDCGLLYGHDKAVNDLRTIYDSMTNNADDIIRLSDEYALKHNETCYDSGSPTKWKHVPRQQLMQIYQNNYLNFKATQKSLIAYYNSLTPVMITTTGGTAVLGTACAFGLKTFFKCMAEEVPAELVVNGANVASTAPGMSWAKIGAFWARVIHSTVFGVLMGIGAVLDWAGTLICTSLSGDIGLRTSRLADLESKLGSWEAGGLGIEAQTWLDRKSINVITNWTEAIEKDLNISGNNSTDRGYVLDYYRLLGYDVINYTNTKTLYDKVQEVNKEDEDEEEFIPPTENNSTSACVMDKNYTENTARPEPIVEEDNNTTVVEPVLIKKTNDLMAEFSKNHKTYPPTKTALDNSGAELLHKLMLDGCSVFPDWDPWVKPSMAPHMKSHYKWYQFFQAIWDAIKIVCFWIGFAIAMVLYTIYWLVDFLLIRPIVVLVKLLSFQDELKETTDYLSNLVVSEESNESTPHVETGGYNVNINYVQMKVPVGNNSTT
jgi:hypothetical protein